jgi:hypothetical protein
MSWNVTLDVREASDGSPASGIPILEATPQGAQLAATDSSGTACVKCNVDPSGDNALYITTARFSIHQDGQTVITVYDKEIYAADRSSFSVC